MVGWDTIIESWFFPLSIYCSVYHTFHLKVVNISTQFIIFVHMRTGSLQSGHVGCACPYPVIATFIAVASVATGHHYCIPLSITAHGA